ncbi:DUF6192 family protein [Streptomyces virginiae]|uniref:DUF6192 family protein n=1 Tax=Streptomyces virginiae TaxID=1961 RepID=UPI0033316084
MERTDRTAVCLGLITPCDAFFVASRRVVLGLRDPQLNEDERVNVHEGAARLRAMLDCVELASTLARSKLAGNWPACCTVTDFVAMASAA